LFVESISHTGRRSVKVTPSNPLVYQVVINDECTENPCNLKANIDLVNGVFEFTISGGTLPYEFEFETAVGNPIIHFSESNSNSFTIDSNNLELIALIKVTDASGCVFYQTASNTKR
jgi:hypothetical protein